MHFSRAETTDDVHPAEQITFTLFYCQPVDQSLGPALSAAVPIGFTNEHLISLLLSARVHC
jgi:hypothetical protein